ncbi:hypothetical protein BZG35_09225 [Brevundimonas sp. LM2]|uniref:hypothetical protein n=1 Tax=Brevundimonas sp. LM2 TaxID=1938605 RepID=UPI000983DDC1|nr:hypothetical protein [Brevundimonas sp. LM2]AQR61816.1 hypothetical protein BZG35_09225 [Brevundimonas sp. LM2]
MSERLFRVTLEGPEGTRDVIVPSPTEVQAADAAAIEAREGEAIAGIQEVDADENTAETPPPPTQAEETPQPGGL